MMTTERYMNRDERIAQLSGILGIALKSGMLIRGQGSVRNELRKGSRLLVILANDHSRNVLSMIEGYRRRGQCRVLVADQLQRSDIRDLLFLGDIQILALPLGNGLTGKIEMLVTGGGDNNEQDKSL